MSAESVAGLTPSQAVALSYILLELRERGRPPTVIELGEHMELETPMAAISFLRGLERKGYIVRTSKWRSITVCPGALGALEQMTSSISALMQST